MIHEAIKEGMRRNMLRQVDLAKHMGVSTSSVHEWVRGTKVPSGETLVRLINYLGVSDLLFHAQDPSEVERMSIIESEVDLIKKRLQILELKMENQELRKQPSTTQQPIAKSPIKQLPISQLPMVKSTIDQAPTGSIDVCEYDHLSTQDLYKLAKITPQGRSLMASLSEEQQRKALIDHINKEKQNGPETRSRR